MLDHVRRLHAVSVGGLIVSTMAVARAEPTEPQVVDVRGAPRPASYAARVQTTGTRDEQSVHDVPQGISVIDRTLMNDIGARRTDDALPLVPGVQLFSGYGGTWDDYTVRGFRVWTGTTYRNGYLNGYSGANATDAINVERIEVVKGPASALYGPGLPGGSINFVTKRPSAEPKTTVGLSAGTQSTFRGELDSTGSLTQNALYRMTAAATSTAGYRDNNDFHRWIANPVVELTLTPSTKLLAEVQGYQEAYRADPLGVPSSKNDLPGERSYIEPSLPLALVEGALARVELNHELSRSWSLRLATQDKVGHYSEKTLLWGPPDSGTLQRVLMNWRQNSGDVAVQAALRGKVSTGPIAHLLIVGVDASHEYVAYRTAISDPTSTPLPIDVAAPRYGSPLPEVPLPSQPSSWSYRVMGFYASDLITLLPRVKLMVGGRVDTFTQESTTDTVRDRASEVAVSPRTGAVVDVLPWLAAYANVSKGFWPSLGVTATGNVLRPEHSTAMEAGLRAAAAEDVATVDVAAFRIDDKNFAVADADNPNFQRNIGEAVSKGVETTLTANAGSLVRCIASYAYTDARVVADLADPKRVGQPLPMAAKHSGGAWAQLDLPTFRAQKVGVGVGGIYTSERALPDQTSIPGYVRVDSVLSYTVSRVRAALRIENVAGTRYIKSGLNEFAVLPGAPRTAMLTVQATL
jgi:iron complex outermembrane receptor protein